MNMTQVILLLVGIVLLNLLLPRIRRFLRPIIKGFIGETLVSTVLSGLPKEEYVLLNDVMLEKENGSTQIDHVLVSIYGIFVIETKNYEGWITGSEKSSKWTQNIYGKKTPFMNPLNQNYGHICALSKLLDLPEDKFISIVAFAGDATLKGKMPENVTYVGRLKKLIKKYNIAKFNKIEMQEYIQIIKEGKMKGSISEKVTHVKNIKEDIKKQEEDIANNICPRCGSPLVKKKGKYGEFVGCSKYPHCRFTT